MQLPEDYVFSTTSQDQPDGGSLMSTELYVELHYEKRTRAVNQSKTKATATSSDIPALTTTTAGQPRPRGRFIPCPFRQDHVACRRDVMNPAHNPSPNQHRPPHLTSTSTNSNTNVWTSDHLTSELDGLLNHRVFIPIQNCFMPSSNHQWTSAAGNYANKCA